MPHDHLIHAIAPPRSHPIDVEWLKPYRTLLLDEHDVVRREDGIVVTSPPRTAVDLARFLGDDALRSVIDQIEHESMGRATTMRRVAESMNTPGRPWARRFLAVLDDRAPGLPRASDGESRVVAALRARGIAGLVSQRWLSIPNWGRVCLDAAVDDIRWGVEVDIHPEHWTEVGAAKDRDRDLACDAIGWRVSRAAKLSLDRQFDATIDRLVAVYRHRRTELAAA
jgi:very-short-patch-repair endonuclease